MGAVRLNISVRDVASVLESFTHVRVKRSTDGSGGTYNLITDSIPTKAKLLAPLAGTYNLSGKTLSLIRDSHTQVDVLFTGLDPLTVAQAANQINAAVGVAIASVSGTRLQLESTITGTASKLKIVGGSAASVFGWLGGERAIGYDANITLVGTQSLYEYIDNDGEAGYYYRVQYYNESTGLASADSSPFQGAAATMVGADKLSLCKLDLVDARGIAVPEQEVTFYAVHEPLAVEGFEVALTRAPISIKTDNAGHAEVALVRGLKVKAVFEGTSVIREFVVPNAASFDLLSVLGTAPDPFTVRTFAFPPAMRRSL